ncbi:MAG: hypothetical protein ACPG8W_09230 [Candidatus Promineifilaceae bacterium]
MRYKFILFLALALFSCQQAPSPTAPPSTQVVPTLNPTGAPTNTTPPIVATSLSTPIITPSSTVATIVVPPTNTPIPAETVVPTPVLSPTPDPNAAVVTVRDEVQVADVKRFGLNIGQFNTNAAGFLMTNIMPNPGFEAAEFHMIFIAADDADNNRVPARDDFWNTDWNNDEAGVGQPEQFWTGATYEVLTGSAAGRTGTIADFTHEEQRLVFYLGEDDPTALGKAAIMVRRNVPGFIGDRYETVLGEPNDVRPDSPGEQSARLVRRDDGLPSFSRLMDQFAQLDNPDAGKLIQLNGEWNFSIWAKATEASTDQMRVLISRENDIVFLDETVDISDQWSEINLSFVGDDPQIDGVAPRLRVDLFPVGAQMLVDDISLRRAEYESPTRFSDRVVETTQAMNPGIVRFWASNLANSLDNVLSAEFGHKPTGFSPKRRVGLFFTYSLHEFLLFSELVDAEPWYVIPPTFTQEEAENLVAYLAAPANAHPYGALRAQLGRPDPWTDAFDVIHLEWGNETWGGNHGADPFLGATFGGGVRSAEITNRRFAAMRESAYFNADRFNLIIGGQYRWPGRQSELERFSNNHDTIAIAPYYGVLEKFATDAERYQPLYAHASEGDQSLLAQSLERFEADTRPAIYEINLHAVENVLPLDVRNDVLSSQGAAISLPLVMLSYLRDLGIRDQAVWELTEFSTRTFKTNEWARLFGIMRDLEATYRPRPTYIAMQMANSAIGGDLLVSETTSESMLVPPINRIANETQVPFVQAYAFREGDRLGLILFNVDIDNARQAIVNLPIQGAAQGWLLAADAINADNEDMLQVEKQPLQFETFGDGSRINLPPHSMIVLEIGR